AGSSPGIQFETIVNVSGLSGLRNAYRSVLSADGSSAISGASRWLEAFPACGAGPLARATATAAAAAPATTSRRMTFFIPHTPSRGRGLFAAAVGPVRSDFRRTDKAAGANAAYDSARQRVSVRRPPADPDADAARSRPPLGRSPRGARRPLRRGRARRALRPLRPRGLRARATDPPRRRARR